MWLTASPFLPWPSKQQKSACRACPPNGKTTQPRSWFVFEIAPESMPRHEYMPTTCGVNGFATSTVSLTSAARTKTFAASSSSGSSIAFRPGAITRTHPRREKRERASETASEPRRCVRTKTERSRVREPSAAPAQRRRSRVAQTSRGTRHHSTRRADQDGLNGRVGQDWSPLVVC